jgi:hypothetical protein
MSQSLEHTQYPIGALPPDEAEGILADPLCVDTVTLDALMQDWRAKNQVFQGLPAPNLNVTNANLRPVKVSQGVMQKIQDVIASYRNYLPAAYDLAFVPLNMLVTPQRSVLLERAHRFAAGATQPLSDDENAELCLGTPIRVPQIAAKWLGSGTNPQNPNQFTYMYQFESDDQDIRYLQIPPLGSLRTVNWAVDGAPHAFDLETVPISVGPGTPLVQVLKVPVGLTITPQGVQTPIYRLILQNGVHRVFRLAELGNQDVAAMVHEVSQDKIPNVLVHTPKAALFSARPLVVTDLANAAISRSFDWQKAKRLVKLQVVVTAETTVAS